MDFPLAARNVSSARVIAGAPKKVAELTLALDPSSVNIVFGKAGCGKNLLLRLLGLMETVDEGEILIQGHETASWSNEERTELRSRHFGYVFESPFLLPSFNAVENVAMPLFKMTGINPEDAKEQTGKVLRFTGIEDAAEVPVEQLPLWVQMRIALARALVNDPLALFVENIDSTLKDDHLITFLELLMAARRVFNCTILVTGASTDLACFGNRAMEMAEGRIVRDWSPGGFLS
jgi:ABC-type lipoprotein export system ATPase subunit